MAETIFRADYRAPSHLIDTVHLEFDLDADSTSVINTMHVRPNPDAQHSSDLILNGETLTLVSVAVDGLPLDESRYTLGDDLLTIAASTASATSSSSTASARPPTRRSRASTPRART